MRLAALAAALVALAAAPQAAPAAATSPAATAPTKTVRVDGHTIGYRSVGTGRPVVLVQGLSGSMDGWDPTFVDALARTGHRIVLLDNPGIGRTSAVRGKLTIRAMSANVARLIRALRLQRPDVVGWSMGGMITQSLAVRHPKSVRRIVLLATAPGDGKATPPTAEGVARLTGAASSSDVLFPPGQEAAAQRFARNIGLRKNVAPRAPGAIIGQQITASGDWLTGKDPDGAKIRRLRMPVLVGGGALDPLLPVANQRHLAKTIPNAKLVEYRDAAHGFFLQHTADFVPKLRRFLR